MTLKLGQKARDTISGFEGTVIGRTEWLYGCVRVVLQPHGLHDGKPIEAQSFDEPQCEVIEAETEKSVEAEARPYRHGPKPEVSRGR